MTRQWVIPGECLATVKGGEHWSGSDFTTLSELGLCLKDSVVVTPRVYHRPVRTSDLGPHGVADVMSDLADCQITMTLIHYDPFVLDCCLDESLAGAGQKLLQDRFVVENLVVPLSDFPAGVVGGAGRLLGNGLEMFASGNHLISLNLTAQQMTDSEGNFHPALLPWHFPSCYLSETPAVFPLGTRVSAVRLNWQSIPYLPLPTSNNQFDFAASGTVIWDHVLDTSG